MRRTALKRKTLLRRMSKRRQGEYKEYMRKRDEFLLANPICQLWLKEHGWGVAANAEYATDGTVSISVFSLIIICGAPRATEVHHIHGRNGKNYLDESTWAALSHEAHMRIHANPIWARANGWLGKK